MKKLYFICVVLILFVFNNVNAQVDDYNKRIKKIANTVYDKHSFFNRVSDKKKVTELVKYLIANQDNKTTKKSYLNFSKRDSLKNNSLVNMIDTIEGNFLVVNIIKKLSNYRIVDNKLEEVLIYLIYIEKIDDTFSFNNNYVIITENLQYKNIEELKVNEQYNLTLFPIFDKNCCLQTDGSSIIGHHVSSSFVFKNICIFNLNISSNYVRFND